MLLCTGPTGSGKTTTLYATLTEVNDPPSNVVTIEDPVEYQFDGITQMQVTDTGMSFADGLRGILRQDPDVILVGEIRDEETARIAMQAALTGHFVLSSLHAVDSVAAVHRFTDMGIEPFLVASAISGMVGQRLLRRICSNCRAAVAAVGAPRSALVAEQTTSPLPEVWCGGGLSPVQRDGLPGPGRRVRAAASSPTPMRELIVARASHTECGPRHRRGHATMQQQAFELVVDGVTTVEEVLRAVYAPGVDRSPSWRPRSSVPKGRKLARVRGSAAGGRRLPERRRVPPRSRRNHSERAAGDARRRRPSTVRGTPLRPTRGGRVTDLQRPPAPQAEVTSGKDQGARRAAQARSSATRPRPSTARGQGRRSRRRRPTWRATSWRSRAARHQALREARASTSSSPRRRSRPSTIMHFSRQMATFLRAGVPMTEALDNLRVDTENKLASRGAGRRARAGRRAAAPSPRR
jgi:hypothetical protein